MRTAMLRSALNRSSSLLSDAKSASSSHVVRRGFSSESESAPERKVAILGAAGGISQPLALLMKLNPLISKLSLYDIAGTPGVAADVSHINTRSEVSGFVGEDQLGQALDGADIVIIPAGVPRKPAILFPPLDCDIRVVKPILPSPESTEGAQLLLPMNAH